MLIYVLNLFKSFKGGFFMGNGLFKTDRELNDDYIEQRRYFVVEHNDLITKAKHDLTAKELKVMDYIISKIKPNDAKFHKIFTSMYELNKVLNLNLRSGRNYNNMANTLKNMMKKVVEIYKEKEEKVVLTHWLQEIEILSNGKVEILLSDKLVPYLLQLKSSYTQYLLADTVQLDSKYSIILYKLIREADKSKGEKTPFFHISPDELAELLGSPESYTFGQFNQNVLQPAIDEINLKIYDMDLIVNQFKRGRRVVKLEIYNNFYPVKDYEPTEDDVPMFNWLEE